MEKWRKEELAEVFLASIPLIVMIIFMGGLIMLAKLYPNECQEIQRNVNHRCDMCGMTWGKNYKFCPTCGIKLP